MLRLAELWSSHVGTLDPAEWSTVHARLRERVAADELPDLLVTLEHPLAPGRLLGHVIARGADPVPSAGRLEEALVVALAELGVQPHPRVERSAIWVAERRIGRLAGRDGFAIGVERPPSRGRTSVRREAGRHVSLHDVRGALTRSVARVHAREGLEVAPEWLGRPAR